MLPDVKEGKVGFQAKPCGLYQSRRNTRAVRRPIPSGQDRKVKGPSLFLICGSTQVK